MIRYFKPATDENAYIYSCDNVRVEFVLNKADESAIQRVIEQLCDPFRGHHDVVVYPPRLNDFTWRNMFTLKYDSDASCTVGIGWNGIERDDMFKGFVDFNPNKVAHYASFFEDLAVLKCATRPLGWIIKRVDIAVDIHTPREKVFLSKDHRKYESSVLSLSNRTEYLGVRNSVGRVKIYNKSIESSLGYPLTRIEVTCEPSVESFFASAPSVYDITKATEQQIKFEHKLTDTDAVILNLVFHAMVNGDDYGMLQFRSLGRKKREKLEEFLFPESSLVVFDKLAVGSVIAEVSRAF